MADGVSTDGLAHGKNQETQRPFKDLSAVTIRDISWTVIALNSKIPFETLDGWHIGCRRIYSRDNLQNSEDSYEPIILVLTCRIVIMTQHYRSFTGNLSTHRPVTYPRTHVISRCCHDKVLVNQDTPANIVLSSLVDWILDANLLNPARSSPFPRGICWH